VVAGVKSARAPTFWFTRWNQRWKSNQSIHRERDDRSWASKTVRSDPWFAK